MSENSEHHGIERSNRALSTGAFKTGLRVAAKVGLSEDELVRARERYSYLKPLTDESVRVAVRRPPLWEYRLYFQALKDFIAKRAAEKRDVKKISRSMDVHRAIGWIQNRFNDYLKLVSTIENLINSDLQRAFGQPGEDGNAAEIVLVAKKVSDVYRDFLTIRAEAMTVPVEPAYEDLVRAFGCICDGSIQEFESYPTESLNTLLQTLSTANEDTEVVMRFEMQLKADTRHFDAELRKARDRFYG